MKKQRIKYLLTVICMLAAGICYSCSERTNQTDLDGQASVMDLRDERTSKEEGVQSGLISAQTESVRFYVHICGEVEHPGVYEMEPGSRIFQAVELAGGFTAEAATDALNLAQETADGMKITVPSRTEMQMAQAPGADDGAHKINLNTATKEELMTLRGIGEARAADIIRYREEHGPFQAIEEIMNISGIKESAFLKIKDDITV